MKVLLVDDDYDILEQAKIFLQKEVEGLNIETASSADDALNLLEGEDFDAIVSDYQMPVTDGLEFLRILRDERGNDIPFIMFTGKGREEVAIEALNLGADRYLQKGGDPRSQYGVLAQAIIQEVKHSKISMEKEKVEAELSSLVKGSEDPIYIVDEECSFTFANQAELERLGMDLEKVIGSGFSELHSDADPQAFEEKVKSVLETGESETQEVEYLDESEYYNRTFSPVENPKSGKIDRVSVISKEVTELKEKEEELREREEKFRKLFENQVNGFAIFESVFDEDGNFVSYQFEDINPAYERITGVDREEVKGKDIQEVFPGTEDSWIEAYGSVAVTGESETFEMVHGPTDKYYLCNVFRPWETEDRFCVAFTDITDRKEYEKNLEEGRERLERAIEDAPFPIMLHAGDGEVIKINEVWTDITGYSQDEISTISDWTEEAYGGKKEKVIEVIKNLHEEEGRTSEGEFKITAKNGEERIWDFKSANIGELSDGRSLVISMAMDITESKKSKEELRKTVERDRRIFETLDDSIFVTLLGGEDHGKIVEVNKAGTQQTGFSKENLLGKDIHELEVKLQGEKDDEAVRERLLEGKSVKSTTKREKKCGDTYWVEEIIVPFEYEGERAAITVSRDITSRREKERQLEKEKERFEAVFNNANDAIYLHELTDDGMPGEFIEVNDVACEMLGYSKEEFWGMTPKDIDSSKKSEKVPPIMEELLERGDVRFEMVHQAKDGTEIPVEISSHLFELEGEDRVLSIARDITELKRMEDVVRNATSAMVSQIGKDELFKQVADSAREVSHADIVILSSYDSEKETMKTEVISGAEPSLINEVSEILGVDNLIGAEYSIGDNRKFEKFFEKEKVEPLVLESLEEYTFGLADENLSESIENLIGVDEIVVIPLMGTTGDLIGVLGYLFSEEMEGRNFTPLNIFGDLASNAIENSEAFDSILEDKQELEKRKQSLRESVKKYRELTEASPDSILLIETDSGKIFDANREAETLLDMPRENIIGKSLSEIRPEGEIEEYENIFEQEKTGSVDTENKELHVVNGRGRKVPVEVGVSSLNLEGRDMALGVFRDIRKRKKAEEREDFLHSLLRHDVRNKIQVVQGYLDLTDDFDLPEEVERHLSQAKEGVEESKNIVERVRDLREAQEEEIKEVEIGEVMEQAINQAEPLVEENDIEIEFECFEKEYEVIGGVFLDRVFSNIIENSIQHSGGSKIRVHSEIEGDMAVCVIEDDGKGISEEEKEMVFERGYTTDQEKGTGLGMFLVKTLLDIYGGEVEVKDSELGGARVDVRLKKA